MCERTPSEEEVEMFQEFDGNARFAVGVIAVLAVVFICLLFVVL